MRKIAIIILFVFLFGCDEASKVREYQQRERQRLFQECLKAIPPGPVTTTYSDWDEVIDACDSAANYQVRGIYPPDNRKE